MCKFSMLYENYYFLKIHCKSETDIYMYYYKFQLYQTFIDFKF